MGGDRLVIFGLGLVGLSGLMIARALGGRVIAVDPIAERVDLADRLGADVVVNASGEEVLPAIGDFLGGEGTLLAF